MSARHDTAPGYSALVLERAHASAAAEAAVLAVHPFEDENGETPAALAALDASHLALDELAATPAITRDDLLAKAATLLPHIEAMGRSSERLVQSLARDFARLAPELCPLLGTLNPQPVEAA